MFAVLSRSEDTLKAGYASAIRNAFVLAVSAHILLLLFSPPFEFKAYTLPNPEKPLLVQNVADYDVPPPPPEVKMPTIQIPAGPVDDGEDVKLPENFGLEFTGAVVPPRESAPAPAFVAFDAPPEPVFMVKPEYPRLAREAGIEGTVIVKVVVSETGKVIEASVVSSDVISDMENTALRAARRCLFEPAKQGSKTVKATVVIPFEFRLD